MTVVRNSVAVVYAFPNLFHGQQNRPSETSDDIYGKSHVESNTIRSPSFSCMHTPYCLHNDIIQKL